MRKESGGNRGGSRVSDQQVAEQKGPPPLSIISVPVSRRVWLYQRVTHRGDEYPKRLVSAVSGLSTVVASVQSSYFTGPTYISC